VVARMKHRKWRPVAVVIAVAAGAFLLPAVRPALAWGPDAHWTIALIADRILQQKAPAVRAKVTALLAADKDNRLTKTDIASAAIWADVLREKSEEARLATSGWHFTRLNFESPDLTRDCFNHPPVPEGYPASRGPADNCSLDKIEQFDKELRSAATLPGERTTALKFLLNLVGDLHQPLYAIGRNDRGGRCVALQIGAAKAPARLLSYWDSTLAGEVIGGDAGKAAAAITAGIKTDRALSWAAGTPAEWARESYEVGKTVAYSFAKGAPAGKYTFPAAPKETDPCGAVDLYKVGADYETRGLETVREQLAKAGVRLAFLLGEALK